MKKILLLGLAMTLFSIPAHAACEGGTEFDGVSTGHFCYPTNISQAMNWWSAFSWCKAQGMHLATWKEACPNTAYSDNCANLYDKLSTGSVRSFWLAEPNSNGTGAGHLYTNGKNVQHNVNQPRSDKSSSYYYRPLCIQ